MSMYLHIDYPGVSNDIQLWTGVRARMVKISLESLLWAFIPRIQRVLNNLQRRRFSRSRMIWILPSTLDQRDTGRVKKRDNLLTGEGGRGSGPNHMTVRKPGPL